MYEHSMLCKYIQNIFLNLHAYLNTDLHVNTDDKITPLDDKSFESM